MSDVSKLKISIIEQAHQEGQLRLEAAKTQLEKDFENRKAQLLLDKEAECQSRLKEINQRFQVEAQQIRNQERQSTLVSKQNILKELFTAAQEQMASWSLANELTFLQSVLKKYKDEEIKVIFGQITADKLTTEVLSQLRTEFPMVSFETLALPDQAGFVISNRKVDDNYLYDTLVDSIYKEESSHIAADIFKEH